MSNGNGAHPRERNDVVPLNGEDEEFWKRFRQGLLALVDDIERCKLHMSPTTSEVRKMFKRYAPPAEDVPPAET